MTHNKAKDKPIIAITSPNKGGFFPYFCISLIVRFYGGKPLKVTPRSFKNDLAFDGLILSGGTDIHPSIYSEEPDQSYQYDIDRDKMERALFTTAFQHKKPIFGICRGMQMINVSLGGSLYQDVGFVFSDFLPTNSLLGKIFARQQIDVSPQSRMMRILNKTKLYVNSLHHQAVNQLGTNLISSSFLKNGMIQSFEHSDHPWLIGVQWHPEFLLHRHWQRAIFKLFIMQAKSG